VLNIPKKKENHDSAFQKRTFNLTFFVKSQPIETPEKQVRTQSRMTEEKSSKKEKTAAFGSLPLRRHEIRPGRREW